uniref:Lipase n=1 Tax=Rhabditophanes sp. KR3021 TaxID=114890 RepID=A0AC35TX98_9BILA
MRLLLLILGITICGIWAAEDPEVTMDPIQMIEYWGYPAEEITATTTDGYVLHMHRIPHGKGQAKTPGRPVVFMQHGLLCSSTNWIANLPSQSAAFIFADAGFDVWLGNMRGNDYSTDHVSLDTNSIAFWQFSWDEMTAYDLDAMIDKALATSGQKQLYYMGHSQGTLTMFSKLAIDPTMKDRVKMFFALAPVATIKYIEGGLKYLADLLYPELGLLEAILGEKQFLPNNWLMDLLNKAFCEDALEAVCGDVLFLIAGPESKQLNESRVPVYIGHTPSGTSVQNMAHWMQMHHTGKQEMYDYRDKKKNQHKYGQSTPPIYDISNVNVDTYLYWGDSDWLGDEKDIKSHILPNLDPAILKGNVELKDFNHLDFIWGLRAPDEVYHPILQTIQADLKAIKN